MDTFWQTISEYNSETWNFQITLTIVGAILAALLYAAPEKAACRLTNALNNHPHNYLYA